jgi:hypothetical protein
MSDLVQIEGEGADDTAFFEDILDDDTEPTTTFLEDAMYAASGGPVRVVTKHYPGGQQHDQSRHAGSKFSRGVLSLRGELLTPTDGRERLILVDSKGAVLDKVLGTKGEEVEAPQNPRLRDPNENLTTHHNHPWDAPPSQGDMLRLGLEPGLASIYVHSPEASYYVAPKVDRDTLYRAVKTAYGDAHTELMADVIANPPAPDQREAVRRQVHSQTAQTALDRLASEGAIDYQVERFAQKHYPGGQDHDQSRHAGSKYGGALNPKAEATAKDDIAAMHFLGKTREWKYVDPPEDPTDWQHVGMSNVEDHRRRKQAFQDVLEETGFEDREDRRSVHHIVTHWRDTANDDLSAASMQKAVADEFNIEVSDRQENRYNKLARNAAKMDSPTWSDMYPFERSASEWSPEAQAKSRETVRAMYNNTQRQLKEAGIDNITVYRGTRSRKSSLGAGIREGDIIDIKTNPASSWTANPEVARNRFSRSRYGAVLKTVVPRERILSTGRTGWGDNGEYEVVVIGGQPGDKAEVYAVHSPGS